MTGECNFTGEKLPRHDKHKRDLIKTCFYLFLQVIFQSLTLEVCVNWEIEQKSQMHCTGYQHKHFLLLWNSLEMSHADSEQLFGSQVLRLKGYMLSVYDEDKSINTGFQLLQKVKALLWNTWGGFRILNMSSFCSAHLNST